MPLLVLALLLVGVVMGVSIVTRMNEVFSISVRNGRCLLVRGRLATAHLAAFEDVVRRAQVPHATIRAVKERGRVRLVTSGVDERVAQRLRNTLGTTGWAGARVRDMTTQRNLGQILGVAWLAWLFHRR